MSTKRIIYTRDDLANALVGIREIAEGLVAEGRYGDVNQARSAVTTWISRREPTLDAAGRQVRAGNDFPLTVADLAATGVYLRAEVSGWVREHYGPPPVESDDLARVGATQSPTRPGRKQSETADF